MHRARVPGGDVAELPGRSVQDSVHHRRELLGRRIEREKPVQAGGDLSWRRDVETITTGAICGSESRTAPTAATEAGSASPTAGPTRRRGR